MELTKNVTNSSDSMTMRVCCIYLAFRIERLVKLGNEVLWDQKIFGETFSSDIMIVSTDLY